MGVGGCGVFVSPSFVVAVVVVVVVVVVAVVVVDVDDAVDAVVGAVVDRHCMLERRCLNSLFCR